MDWLSLFTQLTESSTPPTIRQVALKHHIDRETLRRRYNKWKKAKECSDGQTMKDACSDRRKFNRRALNDEDEKFIADNCRAVSQLGIPLDWRTLQEQMLAMFQKLHPHITRSHIIKSFKACESTVVQFKKRNSFSTRRLKVVKRSSQRTTLNKSYDSVNYLFELRCYISDGMSDDYIINMDETAVPIVSPPITAIGPVGSGALIADSNQNEMISLTAVLAVTRSGRKLPPAFILKGKTQITLNHRIIPPNCFAYYSESGWMNAGIMERWLREVVQPYTQTHSAVLVVDCFRSHFAPNVLSYCHNNNLSLVQVPNHQTKQFQPLDVGVNGPFKQRMSIMWLYERINAVGEWNETFDDAMRRANSSFNAITKTEIQNAWKNALEF